MVYDLIIIADIIALHMEKSICSVWVEGGGGGSAYPESSQSSLLIKKGVSSKLGVRIVWSVFPRAHLDQGVCYCILVWGFSLLVGKTMKSPYNLMFHVRVIDSSGLC